MKAVTLISPRFKHLIHPVLGSTISIVAKIVVLLFLCACVNSAFCLYDSHPIGLITKQSTITQPNTTHVFHNSVSYPYILWARYLRGFSDRLRAGMSGIESRCRRDIPPLPDRPWGPPSLL